jgi:hypothetical protein
MADPFRKLAAALETRMNHLTSRAVSGLTAELGTITGTGLKLDSFKHEIPEYLVSEWAHAGLKTGDRVLVLPIHGGQDVVVLCRVVGAGG